MAKNVVAILILFSFAASLYYSLNGAMRPEALLVYNKANLSRSAIQLLSLLLGVGGVLLLLPQTFRLGGALLIVHSVTTIGCFLATRDWIGGALEFVFLQVPVFMVAVGYPSGVPERVRGQLC